MKHPTRSVVFTGLNEASCALEDKEFTLPEDGVILRTSYSCVSAGTELAKLTGLQKVEFPLHIGNRAIGRVLEAGAKCHVKPGDLVLTHAPHASTVAYRGFLAPLPDELEKPEASFLAMGMVSLVGIQQLHAQLGDTAVVTGAGLVGNLVAQLLQLSGVTVILIDQVRQRLEVAKTCGIRHTLSGSPEELTAHINALTGGQGADFGLECTGAPPAILQLPKWLRRGGHMVLVGSPRGASEGLSEFTNHFHLWHDHGDLTLSGAHEWKIPVQPTPFHKHSMMRNAGILAGLCLDGRLKLQPLLSRVFQPDQAADAYRQLQQDKQSVLGAVFDWTRA